MKYLKWALFAFSALFLADVSLFTLCSFLWGEPVWVAFPVDEIQGLVFWVIMASAVALVMFLADVMCWRWDLGRIVSFFCAGSAGVFIITGGYYVMMSLTPGFNLTLSNIVSVLPDSWPFAAACSITSLLAAATGIFLGGRWPSSSRVGIHESYCGHDPLHKWS